MRHTFGLIMCTCYFQQAEYTGHSPEACISVGVLQTGNCALQDVQHAFVHLPVHLLETKHSNMVSTEKLNRKIQITLQASIVKDYHFKTLNKSQLLKANNTLNKSQIETLHI